MIELALVCSLMWSGVADAMACPAKNLAGTVAGSTLVEASPQQRLPFKRHHARPGGRAQGRQPTPGPLPIYLLGLGLAGIGVASRKKPGAKSDVVIQAE